MDLEKVEKILKMFQKSGLIKLSYKEEGFEIFLEKEIGESKEITAPFPASFVLPTFTQESSECLSKAVIYAPMIGIFYTAKKPNDPPLVKVGDFVKIGDVIGLVEAMKSFYEVKAISNGLVTKMFVQDGERVDLNSKIVEFEPQ